MILEKDFLYRVPVKTAPITTPGGLIRNPEILVDVEGGEFMHGNILDANSTNKLINQLENSLKTLIDAETSARTKGDEDLSSKIKAEQTRAEGKEKEISDKLAIVDGDSNTEGSFRKAIADVIAAAPEDLDTLKEIADKLADNDDLHTALNQAITDKADASALLNEVTRATGAESNLQAAINTKADATALSNYVLTAALNLQVDTLNTAISAKLDAGNYITANSVSDRYLGFEKDLKIYNKNSGNITTISHTGINFETDINDVVIDLDGFFVSRDSDDAHLCSFTPSGIKFADKTTKDIPTANGTFINSDDFASAEDISSLKAGLNKKLDKIKVNSVDVTNLTHANLDQLINIVQELLIALDISGLIIMEDGLE